MLEDVSPRSLVLVSERAAEWEDVCLEPSPACTPHAVAPRPHPLAPTAVPTCCRPAADLPSAPHPPAPRSPRQVDELGKGTEVRAGAALAGSLLEQLDGSRCRGLFATHLHALLDLPLE